MRLLNRPLAFILAAALAVAGIIVIIEVTAFRVNSGPLLLHWTAPGTTGPEKRTGTSWWSKSGRPS